MVHGFITFAAAALMALVAVSGSQDRPVSDTQADAVVQQTVIYDQLSD